MKKILYFILLLVGMTSCGYSPMDNSTPITITNIEKHDAIYCDYYGLGNWGMTPALAASYNYKFRDSCGKFQIGDTITFTKVRK